MNPCSRRMPLLDALKGIASQIVLLHHLASYGPLAATLQKALPTLGSWLFDYGRMAVQVFLVIAGFLAARGLSPEGGPLRASPLPLLWKRYQRLAVPFLTAIGLAIICAAIADHWLDDDMIPARATLKQWLAHAALLHGILGVESLSAGVWYIAIDFQLFALMALLLWAGRGPGLAVGAVLLTGAASLFWFNRDADWDNWAVYFFGSYALGAAAWWASDRLRPAAWIAALAAVALAALALDFRLRIALALAVALLLAVSRRGGWLGRWPESALLAWLGRVSYSVFLVHFPVLLLANALFAHFDIGLAGIALAWGAAVAAGAAFYRLVESPEASRRITAALGASLAKAYELVMLAPRLLWRALGDRT